MLVTQVQIRWFSNFTVRRFTKSGQAILALKICWETDNQTKVE